MSRCDEEAMHSMKALIVVGPGRLELEDRPVPEPRSGWLVARVRAAGICQTDIETLDGTLPHLQSGRISYPVVPGHEWSGEVFSVGESVAGFAPGDRVTGETHVGCGACEMCRSGLYNACESMSRVGIGDIDGALAEYITIPARSVHHLPDGLDFVKAATLEPSTVAFYALYKTHIRGGEHVVVVGPGAIGLLGVGLAKALGAGRVTLVGTRDNRLEIGKRMGATATLNVRENAGGIAGLAGKADIVLDAAGNVDFLNQELGMLRRGGVLAIAGFFAGPVPGLDMNSVVIRNLTIVGSLGSPGVWERVMAMMAGGTFDPTPVVTHRFSLAEAEHAFQVAGSRQGGAIKVVIEP